MLHPPAKFHDIISVKVHEIQPRQEFRTKGGNSRTKSARVTLLVCNILSLYVETYCLFMLKQPAEIYDIIVSCTQDMT